MKIPHDLPLWDFVGYLAIGLGLPPAVVNALICAAPALFLSNVALRLLNQELPRLFEAAKESDDNQDWAAKQEIYVKNPKLSVNISTDKKFSPLTDSWISHKDHHIKFKSYQHQLLMRISIKSKRGRITQVYIAGEKRLPREEFFTDLKHKDFISRRPAEYASICGRWEAFLNFTSCVK